jgi:diaminopimelate decarboxylase
MMKPETKRLQISLLVLAKKYGSPLFVYDTAIIKRQYDRLSGAFDGIPVKLHYACKALTNIEILKFIRNLGAGLDAVSIEEVALGIRAGFAPSDIFFTPNSISFEELVEAAHKGVSINIDNLDMLELFAQQFPDRAICIRINPHIMAGGNANISVGHIDSKFGISIHQLPHVLKLVDSWNIKVEGIHMHTGSDILDAEVFLGATEILLNAAKSFKDLRFIDFGSGFKVPYKKGDIETNVEVLGELISQRMKQFFKEYGRTLDVVFEPGKFLVSEAGVLLSSVNIVKITPSTLFAGMDTGFNHLIRPMLYGAYHHIENISNPGGNPRIYNVVGYLCETDTFAVNRRINEVRVGDVLCFQNAGAYCFSMASNYNSRLRPAEVIIHEGKDYLIRRRESFEDLIKLQKSTGLFD